jgi:hypothetical protein
LAYRDSNLSSLGRAQSFDRHIAISSRR